jgi:hypothetical protein
MSLFDRQAIPERLLRPRTEHQKLHSHQTDVPDVYETCDSEDTASQSSTSDDGFDEAVTMLKSFYFISINQDKCTFEMHALVQLAMRESLGWSVTANSNSGSISLSVISTRGFLMRATMKIGQHVRHYLRTSNQLQSRSQKAIQH